MQRIAIAILLSLFTSSTLLAHKESENHSDRWMKLSVNGITVLFGAYNLNGEFKVSDNMSIYAGFNYVDSRWTVNSDVNQQPGWFIGPSLGARWYLKPGCMSGFFIQDFLEFELGFTYTGNPVDLGGGAVANAQLYALANAIAFGYAWVTDIGFFLEFMAELGTNVGWGFPNPPTFTQMNSIYPRANIGWAF